MSMHEGKPISLLNSATKLDVFFQNIQQVKVLMQRADDGEEDKRLRQEETRAA